MIEAVTPATLDDASSVLSGAFEHDPLVAHLAPGTADRARREAFFRAVVRSADGPGGSVDVLRDDDGAVLGVGVWSAPGHGLASAVRSLLQARPVLAALGRLGVRRHVEFASRTAAFRPDGRHWTLDYLGVAAHGRGRRVGSRLLEHRLGAVDRDGDVVVLESTTLGSRRLYERYGFVVSGVLGLGAAPDVSIMVRPPSGRARG